MYKKEGAFFITVCFLIGLTVSSLLWLGVSTWRGIEYFNSSDELIMFQKTLENKADDIDATILQLTQGVEISDSGTVYSLRYGVQTSHVFDYGERQITPNTAIVVNICGGLFGLLLGVLIVKGENKYGDGVRKD
jgi:hypothetical protein